MNGKVSLIGWVVISILVLGEIRNYLQFQTKEHMIVDTTLGQTLRINANITFHALTCDEVSSSFNHSGSLYINI